MLYHDPRRVAASRLVALLALVTCVAAACGEDPAPSGPANNSSVLNNSPVNNSPANNSPANNSPVNNSPANNTPQNNNPANNTPVNNNPVNNQTNNNNNPVNNNPDDPDRDSDGILDSADNCPEDANADQRDRDGDGLGDVCDACPEIDDPTNDPQRCVALMEIEPNDDAILGEQGWSLPLIVEGTVAAPQDGAPDLDVFSLELAPGQALRMRLESNGPNFWGAVIVFGYDLENYNYQRVLTATNFGTANSRELFITQPGPYAFIVSDIRNLVADPDASGGADFNYRLSVTPFEVEPQPLTLPLSSVETFDERLRVWSVPASAQPALRASADANSFDANAFLIPSLALYDPEAGITLAESNPEDAAATQSASLQALSAGEGDLWLILDPVQGFGPNATSVLVDPLSADAEVEPNDLASSPSPMQAPGVIPGQIQPPRANPETNTLSADVDHYAFYARRGELLRLRVAGDPASNDFDAALDVGPVDSFGFFSVSLSSRDAADDPKAASFTWMPTETGIYVARVRDQANLTLTPDQDPVGGPSHAYRLQIAPADFEVTGALDIPGSAAGAFPTAGEQVWYSAALPAGEPVQLSVRSTDGGQAFANVWDADTFEHLGTARFSAITLTSDTPRSLLIQVGDALARGGGAWGYALNIAGQAIIAADALPFRYDGVLAFPDQRDLITFTLPANTALDVRLNASAGSIGLAEIAVLDADDLNTTLQLNYTEHVALRFPQERRLALRVRDVFGGGDGNGRYTLTLRPIVPVALDALPAEYSGSVPDDGAFTWLELPTTAGASILGAITAAGDLAPRVEIYDPDTLTERLAFTSPEWAFAAAGDRVLLAVGDLQHRGDPAWTFTLALSALVFEPIDVPPLSEALTFTRAGEERWYSLSAPAGSLIAARFTPAEGSDAAPRLTLYRRADLTPLLQTAGQDVLLWYVEEAGEYALLVSHPGEVTAASVTNLGVNVLPVGALALPATAQGTLDATTGVAAWRVGVGSDDLLKAVASGEAGGPLIGLHSARLQNGDVRRAASGLLLFNAGVSMERLFVAYGPPAASPVTFSAQVFDASALPASAEVEPNNTPAEAQASGAPLQGEARLEGALSPAGDLDLLPVQLAEGERLAAYTTFGPSAVGTDTILSLYDTDGTTLLLRNDDGGEGTFSALTGFIALTGGTYFLQVEGFAQQTGDYTLVVARVAAP